LSNYDPAEWGPIIGEGQEPEPLLPEGAPCDNHPGRFAFNIRVRSDGSGDAYVCRECFLDHRWSSKVHDPKDRRATPNS